MDRETAGVRAQSAQSGAHPDRRRSPRFELDASLVVRPKNNRSRVIQGRVVDLSSAGIRAVVAAELTIGEVLELECMLPYTSAIVRLDAAICSRDGYRYGLEFVRVIASDREKINRACTALALLR